MSKNRALERKLSEFWDLEAIGIQPQTRQMQWEKERERLEKARQEKNKIQDQWAKRDCDVMLGTRQSLTQRLRSPQRHC